MTEPFINIKIFDDRVLLFFFADYMSAFLLDLLFKMLTIDEFFLIYRSSKLCFICYDTFLKLKFVYYLIIYVF